MYKKGFARGALNHKCAHVTSENAIPEGPKNWTNADKFGLHDYFDVVKLIKIENVLPARVGSMVLENNFSMQILTKFHPA